MNKPLADKIRPKSLDDVVGQKHILGENGVLRRIIQSGKIPNMIFYGASGVGKTTVARIIAENTNLKMCKLNGTSASVSDIKDVIAETETIDGFNGVLLYLDEIQYLNKKQQQSLLEHIENGRITLIASTTENPYFYIFNAILSRSTVFEFKSVEADEIMPAIRRAFQIVADEQNLKLKIENGVVEHIARGCGGDVRKSINTVELCAMTADNDGESLIVRYETVKQLTQRSNMRYDRDGDQHYDLLSALQKSIRGSDENAAIHYASRILEAGDLLSICRRLLVIASEDIGLAYPMAIVITKACVDSALQLGLPEARIPIAQAVIMLATSPKSNSAYNAIARANEDIQKGITNSFPRALQNKHYDGDDVKNKGQFYKYPHDYPHHYVNQQYLPDELKDRVYYEFGDNKAEQLSKQYWAGIKGK